MQTKRIVHLMQADKFTVPLLHHLNSQFSSQFNQVFYVLNNENLELNPQLLNPNTELVELKKVSGLDMLINLFQFIRNNKEANRVIMHGNALLVYLFLIQFFVKKTAWIIYGGADMDLWKLQHPFQVKVRIMNAIKRFSLRKLSFHISYIQGDSVLMNERYQSKARFLHSPVYLSNTVNTDGFQEIKKMPNEKLKILVGNSCSPSNNHAEVFEWLYPLKDSIQVICPLSYGDYPEYKRQVLEQGKEYFGDNFLPITRFMGIDDYRSFLEEIDIAVFNHKRQEAMGVTLMLLSLGKRVYIYPETTSFEMLQSMQFQLFSNQLLKNPKELATERNLHRNKDLLNRFNSMNYLYSTWNEIYSAA